MCYLQLPGMELNRVVWDLTIIIDHHIDSLSFIFNGKAACLILFLEDLNSLLINVLKCFLFECVLLLWTIQTTARRNWHCCIWINTHCLELFNVFNVKDDITVSRVFNDRLSPRKQWFVLDFLGTLFQIYILYTHILKNLQARKLSTL